MISTELYNNFCFLKINFSKYHYTDNRRGSPYHYFAYDAVLLDLQVIECPREISNKLISIPTDGANILMHNIGVFFSIVADLLPYMKKISLSTKKNIIAKAKKYLHSNPYCSNKQLAAECNISLPYLYKIFKTHDSETPNVYRQKVLCNRATDLLTGTDLSIEQISSILKFSSSVYFRKIFKEHIGQTPRKFRKLNSF